MFRASMPETTVNQHDHACTAEYDVRPASAGAEQGHVNSVAQPSPVKFAAQRQLWRRVAGLLTLESCPYCWRRSARNWLHSFYLASGRSRMSAYRCYLRHSALATEAATAYASGGGTALPICPSAM
jgi:hypothetical protein